MLLAKSKVTTELFERQHELVPLDQHKEHEDHEQSHRQTHDGPALDRKN